MIQHVPPSTLTIHPLAEKLPVRGVADPGRLALRASIAEQGILDPLKVCKGRVIDGRERLAEARKLGLDSVPVIEHPEADAAVIIFDSLLTRKHLPKGALAYIAQPALDAVLGASKERRKANLMRWAKAPQKGQDSSQTLETSDRPILDDRGNTVEELADSLGLSRALVFAARNIHGHFAKAKDGAEMRAYFEPLILTGEMSLGDVAKGIGGWAATKGQPKAQPDWFDMWDRRIAGIADERKFIGWEKLPADQKAKVIDRLAREVATHWPAEIIEEIAERTAKKERGF